MASTQAVQLPEPEVEKVETAKPLPKPETKEAPFVIRLVQVIPC